MTASAVPVLRKLCNAQIPEATVSADLGSMPGAIAESVGRSTGGLWVGGDVTASETGITFSPNAMNRASHDKLKPSITIPAHSIKEIQREFGWVTGIIVVQHAEGVFKFRCFGAKSFATTLSKKYCSSASGVELA